MSLLFISFLSFAAACIALWAGRRAALACNFADRPGGRKKHEDAVPPIGGLVILPVFLIVANLAGMQETVPWALSAGLAALLIMGAVDDAVGVKSQVKFALILLTACFVVIFGEMEIKTLGNLFGFGDVGLGAGAKVFTILSLALLMNAVNMMDGVDGLAGGFCALVAFWLMIVCAGAGDWDSFAALALLLSVLLAFLAFNMRAPWRPRASIFLGDAGALSLGLLLGWFCISLSQGEGAPLAPATVIWIIAVPVMDAFALFIARSLRGLHPFNADRRHLHHRFLDAGVAPGKTTLIILALIAVFALIGFVAQKEGVPPFILFYGWLFLFTAHTIGISHPRGYTLFTRILRMRLR